MTYKTISLLTDNYAVDQLLAANAFAAPFYIESVVKSVMFPWDSVRIVLNVKKTLPLLVVAIIVDIMAYTARPDANLFWLGLALVVALIILFLVQGYLIHIEHKMALRKKQS